MLLSGDNIKHIPLRTATHQWASFPHPSAPGPTGSKAWTSCAVFYVGYHDFPVLPRNPLHQPILQPKVIHLSPCHEGSPRRFTSSFKFPFIQRILDNLDNSCTEWNFIYLSTVTTNVTFCDTWKGTPLLSWPPTHHGRIYQYWLVSLWVFFTLLFLILIPKCRHYSLAFPLTCLHKTFNSHHGQSHIPSFSVKFN
jgi:hypothetical protein